MGLVAKNRISHVIVMRDLRSVENQAVLEFTRISRDHPISDYDIFADIATIANFAVLANPGGSLDHSAVLYNCSCSNIYCTAYKWLAYCFS